MLTERGRAILEFERQWWKHAGVKESAVREQLGMTTTRYHQALNALIDQPAAMAYDARLVRRLRRMRDRRRSARTSRRSRGAA